MKERKRRELNIVIFNMPEHNFPIGTTNKTADEYDVKQISHHLGQESLNITNLFRLGKKVQGKTRVLKVILDSKKERRFLLENARHIEAKVPLSYDVASGSEITPCNKICKPLVVNRFSGNVMTSITTLRTFDKIITFLRQK